MDWTKAKNIIIIALIVTNLVMIGMLSGKYINNQENARIELADTISMLASRNIAIKCELPDKIGARPILYVEYDHVDQNLIDSNLEKQVGIANDKINEISVKQYVEEFLRTCSIMTKNVTLKNISEVDGEYKLEYENKVGKITLDDSYIKCTVRQGKITDFKRVWLKPLEFGKTKREVMSISSALVRFMNKIRQGTEKNDKITISNIEFVYWLDTSSVNLNSPITDTAFPAWKFTYNNGKSIYIGGFEI
ncbi:MAG: hypothetical protein WCF96_03355 [Eubacteriales bacterium]